ncbi:acyl-CoA dehydrogenase family protein [Nocardia sp. BMG111209]|uniref:acyl-CoA dehydrogenase family protein n=1 Tax=Nocardia sp. BMG111209 TaxID=1160137 RepID=UPI000364CB3F|nr:acyl-CoA dehydrogenase family protein [Nocardia sp. BMG111209]
MTPADPGLESLITPDFVRRLADRADEAERLRHLPAESIGEAVESGFVSMLAPKRFGGRQAPFPAILDPIRRMAHGCVSSAWTLGFYTLHNWLLALFPEQAQVEAFGAGPFLAPAPLAPRGRGEPEPGGLRLTGHWSWATGAAGGNWVIVAALCGPADALYPALLLVPADRFTVEDVWHTEGMCGTGSDDIVISGVHVPGHRVVRASEIYSGAAPGISVCDATTYRWPMVPALALAAAMPALGAAERATDLYRDQVAARISAETFAAQLDKPIAQAHLGAARVRLEALRALVDRTAARIEDIVVAGDPVALAVRADARSAAAYVVSESRSIIADLMRVSGASVHFRSHPMQRLKRDVDVLSGHVIFDHDTTRELAGALELGLRVPRTAML